MKTYKTKTNQTVYDICIIIFGSVDFIGYLIQNNPSVFVEGVNTIVGFGSVINYDETLVQNQYLQQNVLLNTDLNTGNYLLNSF